MLINKLLKIAIISMILFSTSNIINAGVFDGTQGAGTETDPYLIYNITDLKEVTDTINLTNVYNRNLHFKLMVDITTPVDFTISHNNPPTVHNFNHKFDGNKFTITMQDATLFMTCTANSVIENLNIAGYTNAGIVYLNYGTIINCNNYATIYATAGYIGGICGWNYGTIINCNNYGKVESTSMYAGGIVGGNSGGNVYNCVNTGTVIGNYYVGGICGSVSTGSGGFEAIASCLNIGMVKGSFVVGGIIGHCIYSGINPGLITNCINAGYVISTGTGHYSGTGGIIAHILNNPNPNFIISNCINIGVVEGIGNIGAIAGTLYGNTTITNCHYDKQFCIHKGVNGQDVPGVSGHITRNMVGRKLASLLGDADWTYVEGATLIQSLYPQLKVFSESPDERQSDASKVGATPIFLYDGIKD